MSAASWMLCQNLDCVFSSTTVGGRAYTHSATRLCLLCDTKTPLVYNTDASVRARLNQALNLLEKQNPPGYAAAIRLFPDCQRSSRLCQNPECCYSLKQPGTRAFATRDGIYCFWCDAGALRDASGTSDGLRRVCMGISAFRNYPEILSAAHAKVPFDPQTYRERLKTRQRELRAMAKEDPVENPPAGYRESRTSIHDGELEHAIRNGGFYDQNYVEDALSPKCSVCGSFRDSYSCKKFELFCSESQGAGAISSEFVTQASRCKLELLCFPQPISILDCSPIEKILKKYQDLTGDYSSHFPGSPECLLGFKLKVGRRNFFHGFLWNADGQVFPCNPDTCALVRCMSQAIWTPKLFSEPPPERPSFQSVLASYVSVAGDRKVSCLVGAYVRHLRTYFSRSTPDRVIHDCFGCVRARVLKSPADYEKFTDLYMYPDPSFVDRQLFTNPYKPERERPLAFWLSRSLSTEDEYVRKRELWAMKKEDQRCACRHCIGRFVRNEPIDCRLCYAEFCNVGTCLVQHGTCRHGAFAIFAHEFIAARRS